MPPEVAKLPAEPGLSQEQQKNWEFARQISRQTRADANFPYTGKYLGIARQQVMAVADSWEHLSEQLNSLGFGRYDCMCIEASADYDKPIMFWSPILLIPSRDVESRKGR